MLAPEDDSFAASTPSRAHRGEFGVTRHDTDDGAVRLSLSGELDLASADRLESALDELRASSASGVILDLRGLSFIDSTGLRVIIQLHERMRAAGMPLEIWEGPAPVARVFEISGAREQLPFTPPR